MKQAKRGAAGMLVVIFLLLGAGCSAGGTTGPRDLAADLGPCPQAYPDATLPQSNAGVRRPRERLVPIATTVVRICSYEGRFETEVGSPATLTERAWRPRVSRRLRGTDAAAFTDDTNHLPFTRGGPIGCQGPGPQDVPGRVVVGSVFFSLTFANASHRVDLAYNRALCSNGDVGEGVFLAASTSWWLQALDRYIENARHSGR